MWRHQVFEVVWRVDTRWRELEAVCCTVLLHTLEQHIGNQSLFSPKCRYVKYNIVIVYNWDNQLHFNWALSFWSSSTSFSDSSGSSSKHISSSKMHARKLIYKRFLIQWHTSSKCKHDNWISFINQVWLF